MDQSWKSMLSASLNNGQQQQQQLFNNNPALANAAGAMMNFSNAAFFFNNASTAQMQPSFPSSLQQQFPSPFAGCGPMAQRPFAPMAPMVGNDDSRHLLHLLSQKEKVILAQQQQIMQLSATCQNLQKMLSDVVGPSRIADNSSSNSGGGPGGSGAAAASLANVKNAIELLATRNSGEDAAGDDAKRKSMSNEGSGAVSDLSDSSSSKRQRTNGIHHSLPGSEDKELQQHQKQQQQLHQQQQHHQLQQLQQQHQQQHQQQQHLSLFHAVLAEGLQNGNDMMMKQLHGGGSPSSSLDGGRLGNTHFLNSAAQLLEKGGQYLERNDKGGARSDESLPPAYSDIPISTQRWTQQEHRLFRIGLARYGRGNWRRIAQELLPDRTAAQVGSHAQKYFRYLEKKDKGKKSSSHRWSIFSSEFSDEEIVNARQYKLFSPRSGTDKHTIKNTDNTITSNNEEESCTAAVKEEDDDEDEVHDGKEQSTTTAETTAEQAELAI